MVMHFEITAGNYLPLINQRLNYVHGKRGFGEYNAASPFIQTIFFPSQTQQLIVPYSLHPMSRCFRSLNWPRRNDFEVSSAL